MGLPSGTKRIAPVTILAASVGETAAHFPWMIDLASLDAAWWSYVALRGDIVAYDPATGAEVVSLVDELDATAKTGNLIIDASVSTAANKTYWILAVPGHGELNASTAFTNAGCLIRHSLGGATSPLVDSCGNYNLTNNGATLAQAAKIGKGIVTAPAAQNVVTPAITQMNGATKWTSTLLIKPTSLTDTLAWFGDSSYKLEGWVSSGVLNIVIDTLAIYGVINSAASFITLNAWNKITIVYNGAGVGNDGKAKVYINGALMTINTWYGTVPTSLSASTGYLYGWVDPYSPNNTYDEARHYTNANSAGWELTEYNNLFTASTTYGTSKAAPSKGFGSLKVGVGLWV